MSPDFPKRSDRKILERIIPPLLGGRDELHFVRFQRVSLKVDLPGIIPSRLSKIHILFFESNLV
jgi:hypothetical protein